MISNYLEVLNFNRLFVKLMSQSHQCFFPVSAMKLLRIMLRNRCWPTTFHTITIKDAMGGTRCGR